MKLLCNSRLGCRTIGLWSSRLLRTLVKALTKIHFQTRHERTHVRVHMVTNSQNTHLSEQNRCVLVGVNISPWNRAWRLFQSNNEAFDVHIIRHVQTLEKAALEEFKHEFTRQWCVPDCVQFLLRCCLAALFQKSEFILGRISPPLLSNLVPFFSSQNYRQGCFEDSRGFRASAAAPPPADLLPPMWICVHLF